MGFRTSGKTSLFKPIVISLIFHACLILGIYYSTFSLKPTKQSLSEQSRSIEIILLEREPETSPIVELDIEEKEEEKEELEEEIIEEAIEDVQEQIAAQNIEKIEGEKEGVTNSPVGDELNPVETYASVPGENDNPESQDLSSTVVASAISSYMSTYGKRVNQDWVDNCNNYKDEHGTQDCPQEHGEYDIRPVYRDYKPDNQFFSFQEKETVKRLEFLQGVVKDSDLPVSELYAVNQLKQHYMFLLNPEPAWTPQAAPDVFNPDLIGPTVELVKLTSKGLGLFGIGEIDFFNFQYDSGDATFLFYPNPESRSID